MKACETLFLALYKLCQVRQEGWDGRISASLRPAWATECVLGQPGLQNEDLSQNPRINKIMQTCWETWETQIKDTISRTQSLSVVALPKLIHDEWTFTSFQTWSLSVVALPKLIHDKWTLVWNNTFFFMKFMILRKMYTQDQVQQIFSQRQYFFQLYRSL